MPHMSLEDFDRALKKKNRRKIEFWTQRDYNVCVIKN